MTWRRLDLLCWSIAVNKNRLHLVWNTLIDEFNDKGRVSESYMVTGRVAQKVVIYHKDKIFNYRPP